MNTQNNKQFKVYLPEDTINKLRLYIHNNYPKYIKGPLSIEVNKAILMHISVGNMQQHTTSQQQQGDSIHDLNTLCVQISDHLIDISVWSQPCQYIAEKTLRDALYVIKGKDPRTINKWIARLEKIGLIAKCGPHQYRFTLMEEPTTIIETPKVKQYQPQQQQLHKETMIEAEVNNVLNGFLGGQNEAHQQHGQQQPDQMKLRNL